MIDTFRAYVADQHLFGPEEPVLLAVSGGMDSVVMSHLFFKAKYNFAIAHCNFGLRGEESDADEVFVKKIAKRYKVPFFAEHFDTQEFVKQEKVSVQMAARILRYEWFGKLLDTHGYACVATAHHLNDLLETVLFNLTKGTGISGLHGIRPRHDRLIRPMLFADKEQIYAYIVENQLVWREDSSNQSSVYQRNLIRNEVVPLLKNINPSLESTMQQTVERVGAVERVFEAYIRELRTRLCGSREGAVYIDIHTLRQEAEPIIVLSELLKPYHFSYLQGKDIFGTLDAEAGKRFESPTHLLVKDREYLVLTSKLLGPYMSASLEEGQTGFANGLLNLALQTLQREGFRIPSSPRTASLDLHTLQFPLKLRKWKEGDWFCPLGMSKKKKLSDFLINEKVPLNLKDQTWVLTSNGSIAWVVDHRIDDRFKITDKTTDVLLITSQEAGA